MKAELILMKGQSSWIINNDCWSLISDVIKFESEYELEEGMYSVLFNGKICKYKLLCISNGYWHNKRQYISGSYQLNKVDVTKL